MAPRRAKNVTKCAKCDENIEDEDAWIQCSSCQGWLHQPCTDLNQVEFDGMVENKKKKSKSMNWSCPLCVTDVNEVFANIAKFKKMQLELNKIQADINSKIESFEKRVAQCQVSCKENAKLETRVKKLEGILPGLTDGATAENIPPSFRDILNKEIQSTVTKKIEVKLDKIQDAEEKQLIEEKKNNLVLFNMPELQSKDPENRLRHDREKFLELFKIQEEDFDDECIESMYRVGKHEAEKSRPTIVKFSNTETKMKYLNESRDVTLQIDGVESRVIVTHDMTRNQRAKIKELATEIKRRKSNGENNWVIRNFQIVEKNFQTEDGRDGPMKKPSWKKLFIKK